MSRVPDETKPVQDTNSTMKVKLCLFFLLDPTSRLLFEKDLNSKIAVTALETVRPNDEPGSVTLIFTHFQDVAINLNTDDAFLSNEGPFGLYDTFLAYDRYLKYVRKNKWKNKLDVTCAIFTNASINQEALAYFEIPETSSSGIDSIVYRLSLHEKDQIKEKWTQTSKTNNSKPKRPRVEGSTRTKREALLRQFLEKVEFHICANDFEEDLDYILNTRVRRYIAPTLKIFDVCDYYIPELEKLLVSYKTKYINHIKVAQFIQHNEIARRNVVRGLTQFFRQSLDSHHIHFEQNVLNTLEQFIYNPSSPVILNIVAAKGETTATTLKVRNLIRSRESKGQHFSLFVNRNFLKASLIGVICEYFTLKPDSPAIRGPGRYFLVIEAGGLAKANFGESLEELRAHFSKRDSPFRILVITREDDETLAGLQNISSLKDTELRWHDLSAKSQHHLLNKQVSSHGNHTTLQSLILDKKSFVKQYADFSMLIELMDACDVTLDFEFDCCEKPDTCVSRILRCSNVLAAKDIDASELTYRIWFNETDFQSKRQEEPNVAHHLVSECENKPGWLMWRKSSGNLGELRNFLVDTTSEEISCNSLEFKGEQYLDHLFGKADETGKVALIYGKDRYSTSCLSSNLAKKMSLRTRVGHLPHWIVKCNWKLPASFERSAGLLSNKVVDVVIKYLVQWPSDRDSAIAKSLLRHRLENPGGRVVLMLDGDIQEKSLPALEKLMRSIASLPGIDKIIITTTDHENLANLENALNQFAFHISDINTEDCINILQSNLEAKVNFETTESQHDISRLTRNFAEILIGKFKCFPESTITENGTKVKFAQLLAEAYSHDFQKYVFSNGQEINMEISDTTLNLAELYSRFLSSKLESLPPVFLQYIGGSFAEFKSFLQCHAMLSLEINAEAYFPNYHLYIMRGKRAPLFQDVALKIGLLSLDRGSNFVFYHETIRDYFIAEYFYTICSQSNSDSHTIFNLFYVLMEDKKFIGVLKFIDDLFNEKARAIRNPMFSLEQHVIFTQADFNDSIVDELLNAENILYMLLDAGASNIFCWYLTCAKEKLTRGARNLFNENMYQVLNVSNSWDFVLRTILSHGRIDALVVTCIFKWFENGTNEVLEIVFKGFDDLVEMLSENLDILEKSYEVLLTIVQYIVSRVDRFSRSFLANLFFESKSNKVALVALLTLVEANNPADIQAKKRILTQLPSIFSATHELPELLCSWLSNLQFNLVRDRLFLKLCLLLLSHNLQGKQERFQEVLEIIFKTDPRYLVFHDEKSPNENIESWETVDTLNEILSKSNWLDAFEKAVLINNINTLKLDLQNLEKGETGNIFNALNVTVRTANKTRCDLIKEVMEESCDNNGFLAQSINECISSALTCAKSYADHEWIVNILEAAECLILSQLVNDSNFLLEFAQSCNALWEGDCWSNEQFLPVLVKIVDICEKRQDFQLISDFFLNSGNQAFNCLALQNSDNVLKPILESILKEEGDLRLLHFVFNPSVNDDGFLERTCRLLSNEQVREFVPCWLSQESLTVFVEWITKEVPSHKENATSVWKAYCLQNSKSSKHVDDIINCVRERCGVDLFFEIPQGFLSIRSLTPNVVLNEVQDIAPNHI